MAVVNRIYNALTIAGSDPSGGAGIQGDLKAFAANHVYGMAVITALTAQNTQGVSGVHLVPKDFIKAQLDAIFDDIRVDAIKIGMVANAEIASIIGAVLHSRSAKNIVLDPVMVAKGGAVLLAPDAAATMRDTLLPLATILTPNLPEAAKLLDQPVATTRDEMEAQGRALLALGPKAVLMKGGHFRGADSPDFLITKTSQKWLEAERIESKHTHGTGCTLSSAIAAGLAKGMDIDAATLHAKTYITQAIKFADRLDVGTGHGPTHHFHALWRDTN